MAIPKFEEFIYPFLKEASKGGKNKKAILEKLIDEFHLTPSDVEERTAGGSQTILNSRASWALQYLRRALFIEPRKSHDGGIYVVTKRGNDYLKSHTSLGIQDLLKYPEFAEYCNGSSSATPSTTTTTGVVTPTEQLDSAYQSIMNDLVAELLQKVIAQSPQFFEQLVVDLMVKMGYGGSFADSAKVTAMSGDEGIDGIIYEDKLGLDKIYIQAKKWTNPVGRPVIQQFSGALAGQNATKGVFLTTSTFTKDARQFVGGITQKIVLIDGKELAKLMLEYNVGVSPKKCYEVKSIDSDYFED